MSILKSMQRRSPHTAAQAAAALLLAPGLATVPAAAQGGCVLQAVELEARGEGALLRLRTDGEPRALGASQAADDRIELYLTGCLPAVGLAEPDPVGEMVAAVRVSQRADEAPMAVVTVEIHRPLEYSVRSGPGTVSMELQPAGAGGDAPEPFAVLEPRSRVKPLAPLPPPEDPPPDLAVVETETREAETREPRAPNAEAETEATRAEDTEALAERVRSWARAWSGQRVEDYISFYAAGFRPPGGLDRGAWESQRRQRLTAPRSIEVRLEDLRVDFPEPGRAVARFWQTYRSDRFGDRVYKTLTWTEENGRWRILEETSAPSPPAAETVSAREASGRCIG